MKDAMTDHKAEWVERMLGACVPGGSYCDPQRVADAIREYCAALTAAPADHKAEWPAGVLNREATLKLLREHNEWRRGASTPQTDPRMLGLALDAAIAALTAAPAASEATINSDGIDSKLIGAASEGEWVPVPRELLTDLADDLEAQVLTKGDLPRRIKRDLQPVIRARALLAAAPEPFLSGDGGPVSNASEVAYHGGSGKSYATMEAAKQAGESSIIGPLTFTDRQPIGVTIGAASEGEDGAGVAFDSAEALADWLETLHEAEGPAVMCGKWRPAQVAARAIREYLTRPAALATQPAARRVTDDPRVVELIEAAQDVVDGTVSASTYPDGPCIDFKERNRLIAALESFAQPAEGVSGG